MAGRQENIPAAPPSIMKGDALLVQEETLRETEVSSHTVYRGNSYSFSMDEVILPNGTRRTREHLHHPGGVAVLAVNASGEIAMVEQYRHPIRQITLEIPAGKLDKVPNEQPTDAALRELREEIGFNAKHIESLGYVFPSPGVMDEKLWLFFANHLETDRQELDEDEFIHVRWMQPQLLQKQIADGSITDVKTICAWTRAMMNGML